MTPRLVWCEPGDGAESRPDLAEWTIHCRDLLIAAVRNALGLHAIGKRISMQQDLDVGLLFGPGVVLTLVSTVGVAIFWMVVGWRAMRAHEKLASAVEALSRRSN